ncbi:hypothetical protein PITC_005440 [Penicillium italicum]|uniref:Uncharacterized protein n=1 Tax=Penicillium italicum TaxID=40296 RepID=A0A0A2LCA3_PENIT|nr:hypothetical protein PITC_005440 [Penicillium italicum]
MGTTEGVCVCVCALWSGCDLSTGVMGWVQSHGTMGLNATGREKKGRGGKSVSCRLPAGLVWKEVFPWNILSQNLLPPITQLQYCDCDALLHCCNFLRPCPMSKTSNCPTYIPSRTRLYRISSTHRDSGIQKRTRFVGAGRPLTTYIPTTGKWS